MESKEQAIARAVPQRARAIAEAVALAGGRTWVIGGAVRDALLGLPAKDIDLEVHGLPADRLAGVLRSVGSTQAVGRSFGVFKVYREPHTIDVALPRTSAGNQERGQVEGDPHIGLDAACRGRDLTVNAIAVDAHTLELADPTGGVADLRARRLRPADPSRFAEDPLRVVRVARFAATRDLAPTPDLLALCRTVSLEAVAPERILIELDKILCGSSQPSKGLTVLQDTHAWAATLGPIEPHHTLHAAVDRAASLRARVGPAPRNLALMVATLGHRDPAKVQAWMERVRLKKRAGFDVASTVQRAVLQLHLADHFESPAAADRALRHTAESVDTAVAVAVAQAVSGRDLTSMLQRAHQLGVLHAPLAPLLMGRDLMDLGIQRGPELGRWLARLRQAQLDGIVSDPDGARAHLARLRKAERAEGS